MATAAGKAVVEEKGALPGKYKNFFPLKSIKDVVNIFRHQLINESEPDLALLSIITGFIEITLTTAALSKNNSTSTNDGNEEINTLTSFPSCSWDCVNNLYKKFHTLLAGIDKAGATGNKRFATRDVIKRISDIIYYSLIRSTHKDRSHIQNLYSYLSVNKLDCFGVALGVVAACQILGYKGVNLSISEDHVWVNFITQIIGSGSRQQIKTETVEITWHGKGTEDKRGQEAALDSNSWLYLSGYAVHCDRNMEVVAIVSSINIALTPNSDCTELAEMQQNLLWLLYDFKYLERYPMAIGNLGELEEVQPTRSDVDGLKRPSCSDLYKEAINSANKFYGSHHVYPHTYYAGYFYRKQNYGEAIGAWANASCTLGKLYSYSKDDDEIYKEFLEIANEFIPQIIKLEGSGISARSILRDSECFANLLRFYDGICKWEEGSLTPIWHIGWAKPMVQTISKFDYDIRSQVIIKDEEENEDRSTKDNEAKLKGKVLNHKYNDDFLKEVEEEKEDQIEGNNNNIKKDEFKSEGSTTKKSLIDITAACGEKILNPEYLLQGGGELFADKNESSSSSNGNGSSNELGLKNLDVRSTIKSFLKNELILQSNNEDENTKLSCENDDDNDDEDDDDNKHPNDGDKDVFIYNKKNPVITLYSQKMKNLKNLLIAEKLNTHAVLLQVTAQSQVTSLKKQRNEKSTSESVDAVTSLGTNITSRPKRVRRE